ncbi:MAG: Coenzyme F420 hydrogenase/dehydrogenase, beta subunit C-terminal domain [Syntrophales bacterium]|jgi:coenzyme F420-reducing hydrogenase beta subunit|nr:Coenzyme F420 hydrogenase/dehydrogenase, beta subunit C-terminal domain [Syntrophales bacterium]
MQPDHEGFLYPQINETTCNGCEICSETCPVNQRISDDVQNEESNHEGPIGVFASWHLDEDIRRESSSGGVFTALAEAVIARDGVVAGSAFDDNLVARHILIEASTDLDILRGSKYVQSEVSPAIYHRISEFLNHGRPVFFTGTPCQTAGLRNFLNKPYDNLLCCDMVCHGVPSLKVFSSYKIMLEQKYGAETGRIVFRRKDCGWKRYSVFLSFDNNTEYRRVFRTDPFMQAFLKNICLRPSCYACKFRSITRPSDLTLGDFWGVGKKYQEYDLDDKGTSLILVNTKKGQSLLDACRTSLFLGLADIETAVAGNLFLVQSCMRPPQRDTFYHDLGALSFETMVKKYRLYQPSFLRKVVRVLKSCVKNVFS